MLYKGPDTLTVPLEVLAVAGVNVAALRATGVAEPVLAVEHGAAVGATRACDGPSCTVALGIAAARTVRFSLLVNAGQVDMAGASTNYMMVSLAA